MKETCLVLYLVAWLYKVVTIVHDRVGFGVKGVENHEGPEGPDGNK